MSKRRGRAVKPAGPAQAVEKQRVADGVLVTSGLGQPRGRPAEAFGLVLLDLHGASVSHLQTDKARQVAQMIADGSYAADLDAAAFRYFVGKSGVTAEAMMAQLRSFIGRRILDDQRAADSDLRTLRRRQLIQELRDLERARFRAYLKDALAAMGVAGLERDRVLTDFDRSAVAVTSDYLDNEDAPPAPPSDLMA